tara:strand:+ start:10375 stop:11424 length:1050 start_codon:yes stop_codon:yes gene_type:complete
MKENQKLKTLIIVPAQFKGGVYNFYKNLSPNLPSNYSLYYLDNKKVKSENKLFQTIYHFIKVVKVIKTLEIKKLILNPSLKINSVIRDSLYVLIGLCFNIKLVVFWRGFNFENIKYLKYPYKLITFLLFKVDTSVVLYSKIGNSLKEMGYSKKVKLMTTMVNDEVFNFKVKQNLKEATNLIFLSRVEEYKGIYELLKAFDILKLKFPNLKLTIAGFGDALDNVKEEIENKKYKDIFIKGYITGEEKYSELSNSDIFIFPSYSEGMPNAVLEAMAVGLPIITTRVGGLNDFFEDQKMGLFIETKSVESIVYKLEHLLKNKNIVNEMSKYNRNFAEINFNSTKVTNNFLKI